MTDIDTVSEMFDMDGLDGFGHDENSSVVEEGDWIDDGKYSHRQDIVKYNDKYYRISQGRSGSYYSDYYYTNPEFEEVERKEKTVVKVYWTAVK